MRIAHSIMKEMVIWCYLEIGMLMAKTPWRCEEDRPITIKNMLAIGIADSSFIYGHAEDRTFAGDWSGDGHDALAVRRGSTFYVKKYHC